MEFIRWIEPTSDFSKAADTFLVVFSDMTVCFYRKDISISQQVNYDPDKEMIRINQDVTVSHYKAVHKLFKFLVTFNFDEKQVKPLKAPKR